MNVVIASFTSAVTTALLAWLIGTRVSFGWDEIKRQRESDIAALDAFYSYYGRFYAAWKKWEIFLRGSPELKAGFPLPVDAPIAWEILQDAEVAESGFEAILVKLASEYGSRPDDRMLFAPFRQGAQSLRESISECRSLSWKAQPSSMDRPKDPSRRMVEYRKYRAFKALGEYVAVTLSDEPVGMRERTPLLGLGSAKKADRKEAIDALIEITQTANIAGRWYRIAEDKLGLPPT